MQFSHSFQPFAVLPLLVALVTFILSFLLVFAGHTPGFMDDYAVFTLNTSRIGENLVQSFDSKISGLNFSSIIEVSDLTKRKFPTSDMEDLSAGSTPGVGSPLVRRTVERDLSDIGDEISSGIGAAGSAAASEGTAVASAVQSKATVVEGAIVSKIDSALAKAEGAIIEAVNDAYGDLIKALELKDWYSVYMTTSCEGQYAYPNGTNVTLGAIMDVPSNTTEMHQIADLCTKQSALDPVGIVRILYEISIVLCGISLLLGVWGTVRFSRKTALLNALGSLPALLLLALASAAVNGVASGAATLINFLGDEVGVTGYAGHKFIALSWSTAFLTLVNASLWLVLAFVGKKLHLPTRHTGTEKLHSLAGHEMQARRNSEEPRNTW